MVLIYKILGSLSKFRTFGLEGKNTTTPLISKNSNTFEYLISKAVKITKMNNNVLVKSMHLANPPSPFQYPLETLLKNF